MKPVENIDLTYYENGEEKKISFEIFFVSNYIRREYEKIMRICGETQDNWNEIQDLSAEVMIEKNQKKDGWRQRVEIHKERMKQLSQDIIEVKDTGFFQNRYELIQKLLKDNGVKEDILFNNQFWDEKVPPEQIIEILTRIINKDILKKK